MGDTRPVKIFNREEGHLDPRLHTKRYLLFLLVLAATPVGSFDIRTYEHIIYINSSPHLHHPSLSLVRFFENVNTIILDTAICPTTESLSFDRGLHESIHYSSDGVLLKAAQQMP